MLLRLLVAAFAPDGPLVFGVDETLERRWWPGRPIVAVADGSYATLQFLSACRSSANPATLS